MLGFPTLYCKGMRIHDVPTFWLLLCIAHVCVYIYIFLYLYMDVVLN